MGGKVFQGYRFFVIRTVLPVTATLFCSIFLTWCYGAFLTFEQIGVLKKKALFIEGIPFSLSLPSQLSLSELSIYFSFKCGAFFGLSLGPFAGLLFIIAFLATRRISRSSPLLTTVCAVYTVTLWINLGADFFPILTGTYSLLMPFAMYLSYQTTSDFLFRLEERYQPRRRVKVCVDSEGGAEKRKLFNLLCLSLFFLFVVSLLSPVFSIVNLQSGANTFIVIRDRVLLGTPFGKIINNYYYEHSPYAAEVIKPLIGKSQFAILYLGKDKASLTFFKRDMERLKYLVRFVSYESGESEYLNSGGADLIFADIDSVRGRELYKVLKSRDADLRKRVVVISSQKNKYLTELTDTKTTIIKPITFKKINSALQAVSASVDHAVGLRGLIGISLFLGLPLTLIGAFLTLPVLFIIVFFEGCRFFRKYLSTKPGVFFLVLLIFLLSFSVFKKMGNGVELKAVSRELAETGLSDLNSRFFSHNDPEIRSLAIENLYRMTLSDSGRGVTKYVIPLLTDSDPRVRMYAASTLGNLKSSGLLPYLISASNDPQINVRYKAVEAMGKLEGSRAVAPIKKILSMECDWYVSNYALNALRESSGHVTK